MHSTASRREVLQLISAGAVAGGLGTAFSASAGDVLRLGGTGSAIELLNVLSNAFKQRTSGVDVAVIPGLGSTAGIQAARDSALDIVVSARPLKRDESSELTTIPFVLSPYVIATSHPRPGPIASTDIAKLIAEPLATWHDGTRVRIILRPRNDSDNAVMASLFPGAGAAIEVARKRAEIPIAVNDQDNATMAERIPGSLIGITLLQLQLEKRNLRVVSIDGTTASLASLESGAYPFARDFHLIVSKKPSALVEKFIAFARSVDGAKTIRECGGKPLA